MILLVFTEDGLEYKEFEGDFTPSGYAHKCPSCGGSRTFFSSLLSSIFVFKDSAWLCTQCGDIFSVVLEEY